MSASPTQTHPPLLASTLASPHSKHGLCLLPNAIQVHVGSCREQIGQMRQVHAQARCWGQGTPKPPLPHISWGGSPSGLVEVEPTRTGTAAAPQPCWAEQGSGLRELSL